MPTSTARRAGPRAALIGLAAAGLIALAGCANSSSTPLPPLTPDPRKLLTKEEQAKAIADMSAKKESGRTDVLKEIEKR
jgi:hypothetical protein